MTDNIRNDKGQFKEGHNVSVGNNGGRPPEPIPEDKIEKALEYIESFSDMPALVEKDSDNGVKKINFPSIEELADKLQISRQTVYDWAEKDTKFLDIKERILIKQAMYSIKYGISGLSNASITKLILGKHGYSDKQEIDIGKKEELSNLQSGIQDILGKKPE